MEQLTATTKRGNAVRFTLKIGFYFSSSFPIPLPCTDWRAGQTPAQGFVFVHFTLTGTVFTFTASRNAGQRYNGPRLFCTARYAISSFPQLNALSLPRSTARCLDLVQNFPGCLATDTDLQKMKQVAVTSFHQSKLAKEFSNKYVTLCQV